MGLLNILYQKQPPRAIREHAMRAFGRIHHLRDVDIGGEAAKRIRGLISKISARP
jgi:hypothetical protein